MAVFTNYIAPNSAYYLTLNIIEKIPDDYVTSNKTKVDVIGTITGVKSAYSSSYSSSTNTVNVNGRLFYPNTSYSVSNGRTAEIFRYNDIEIEHDADGSKKINVSWSFNGNTSGSYNPNGSVSGEVTLTTIPRATKITDQTGTVGKSLTITWSKASNTFRHKLTYSLGNITNEVLGENLVDSYIWQIPDSLYKQFTNTPNKSGTLYLTTYKGTQQIGTTQSAKITINADKVEAEPLIAEDIILTDINDATFNLTGGNRLVLGQSRLNVVLDVATRKYATLKSLTINGQSIDTTLLTAGPQTSDGTTYYSLDYDGFGVLDSESITFTATDTRDFPTTYVLEIPDSNIIKYIPLDAVVNFKRIAPTSGEVGVEFSGNYFNGSFGNTNNSLTISYKYKKSTATTYSTDITLQNNTDYKISGNTYFSGTGTSKQRIKLAPSFDYKSQYDLQLTIKDKLTTLPTINVIITKGIPIFWWNGEKVTINGDLYIADTDGNNPIKVKDKLDIVVDNLDSNATNKAPSQRAVNDAISGIVESGSNSNGSYTKFSDGTLICKKAVTVTATMKAWFGNLYYDDLSMGNWSHSFVDTNGPIVNATINNNQYWLASCAYYSNTSAGTCRILRMNELNQSVTFNIVGYGKWK